MVHDYLKFFPSQFANRNTKKTPINSSFFISNFGLVYCCVKHLNIKPFLQSNPSGYTSGRGTKSTKTRSSESQSGNQKPNSYLVQYLEMYIDS